MSKNTLSKEERELLDAVETGEYESILAGSRISELEAISVNTSKKYKRINTRISNRDLTAIQSRAPQKGFPYQAFVSSSLNDLTANKPSKSTQ